MSNIVFCTSYIDSNPRRYQDWIDYYTDFFSSDNVDLAMFNDGAADHQLDLKDTKLMCFQPHLGRQSIWVFPGWKRSFSQGLRWCCENGYDRIAHIESDCYIHPNGKNEFMSFYAKDGYYCGYCKKHRFPETALQVLNSTSVIAYLLKRYANNANLQERLDFEKTVITRLKPVYIMDGDRIEGDYARFKPNYTFLSNVTLGEFQSLYGFSSPSAK